MWGSVGVGYQTWGGEICQQCWLSDLIRVSWSALHQSEGWPGPPDLLSANESRVLAMGIELATFLWRSDTKPPLTEQTGSRAFELFLTTWTKYFLDNVLQIDPCIAMEPERTYMSIKVIWNLRISSDKMWKTGCQISGVLISENRCLTVWSYW